MFVIGCCMALHLNDIPDRFEFKQLYPDDIDWISSGHSCIINPAGKIVMGPVVNREEVFYAEIDLTMTTAAKRIFDVAGHYARPDVFSFALNQQTNPVMRLKDVETTD
jgi:nitrilase